MNAGGGEVGTLIDFILSNCSYSRLLIRATIDEYEVNSTVFCLNYSRKIVICIVKYSSNCKLVVR